jgi:hypothetical protein
MDTDNHSSIDFANSKADSYNAVTNEDIMSELNSYFKSYIAGVSGESQQNVSNNLSFDDAMDSINSNRAGDIESAMEVKSFDADETDDGEPVEKVSSQMLDVELLEQHIDKANLSGGNDATRVIENMAGGGLTNNPPDGENITEEEVDATFGDIMLGGGTFGQTNKAGTMSGYSGVTDEIRVKGKRVTERTRNNIAYRSETGRLDMGMLGGSFEEVAEANEQDDAEYADNTPEDIVTEAGEGNNVENDPVNDEYEVEYEYDNAETDEHEQPYNMASEIDMVLSQLRNKTGRTLTGGTVNIRKKVVLTDMYPYIIRS